MQNQDTYSAIFGCCFWVVCRNFLNQLYHQ